MFIGHFALGFAAKRSTPSVSLGTLFLAAQFADLLWPTLALLGVEAVEIQPSGTAVTPLNFIRYPYSHSLARPSGRLDNRSHVIPDRVGLLGGSTSTAAIGVWNLCLVQVVPSLRIEPNENFSKRISSSDQGIRPDIAEELRVSENCALQSDR